MPRSISIVFLFSLCAWSGPAVNAGGKEGAKDEDKHEVKISPVIQKRIDKALEWLAERQEKDDGSFSDGSFQHNTAITAFAMLAFMSQGHLPNQGEYGPNVNRAANFLIASAKAMEITDPKDPKGKKLQGAYLVGARSDGRAGNMYAHAMAALALSELWGQTGDDKIKPVLKGAVDLIVASQQEMDSRDPSKGILVDRDGKPAGGWRYSPAPTGADISVTIMQVMALRSARNSGLAVPDETFDKAIRYIRECYDESTGGFRYMPEKLYFKNGGSRPNGGGPPGFARTAAGCCVLLLSGKYDKKEVKKDYKIDLEKAVKYLEDHWDASTRFYYGHYYAAHAMHQYGGPGWKKWYGKMENYFDRQQELDGSWTKTSRTEVGPVYQTSVAVIILSTPAGYLPIFQR